MRFSLSHYVPLKPPGVICRLYRYPKNGVDNVMQLLQTVSQKRKHKLRWWMDTDNAFGIEVFDSTSHRWLLCGSSLSADAHLKEEDIDKEVESLLTSCDRGRDAQETILHPTVIDLSMQPNVVQAAKEQLRALFPHLQLQVIHTVGEDLQLRKTHTVSVSLIKRSDNVSSAEAEALRQFEGEAMGPGFLRTARRALEEAFERSGLVLGTHAPDISKSVMGSYAAVLGSVLGAVALVVDRTYASTALQVRTGSELLCSVSCVDEITLGNVLDLLKQAAELKCPDEVHRLNAYVASHPLILVVPKQHIRVKRLLRELLQYYYSIEEDEVHFTTTHLVQGVFACRIEASLSLARFGLGVENVNVILATANGRSKSAAEQLAAVLALQAHFPKEYVEQISFHSDVADILQSKKASAHADFAPTASKGLRNLLDWALQRGDVQVTFTPMLLQAHKRYEQFGVRPTTTLWSTTVDVREQGDVKRHVVYDQKKNRCENKAIALVLFFYFRDLCPEGIVFAKEKGFLTETGDPSPCSALVPLAAEDADTATRDRLLSSLEVVPWQTVECPPLNEGACLLGRLRAATVGQSTELGTATALEERTLYDAVKAVYVASLVDVSKGGERVQCTYSHQNKLRCLLSLYLLFIDAEDAVKKELLSHVPTVLPAGAPLETIAALTNRLYGFQTAVGLTMVDSMYNVELWAVGKEDTAERTLLGKAKANSFINAVRLCCVRCFETHVRHLHPPFGGTPCDVADVTVIFGSRCLLSDLMRTVQDEIQQSTKERNLSVCLKLTTDRASTTSFTLRMEAVSDAHSIVLETCKGSHLLYLLRSLKENIAAETDKSQLHRDVTTNGTHLTASERLKEQCEKLFGLALVVESLLYDKQWVSRLSLQICKTHRYALCVSYSETKKRSIENACVNALSVFFNEPHQKTCSNDESVCECNYLYSLTDCTDSQ
ncbi:hypothetical protein STCU_08580 [Strigomonas culicis]|uniref:Uncharacterized protein n=1 Tax=Strigomonas culicis TaxID=28005 RepID=S9TXJ4_9TRYP|nr:hypothetical protein STCU_08580 [Strigomonas culicis]|eukprot:EPY21363.1 hypothetical protein STCU_08580 [Strigomonas culicis]